MTNSPVIAAYQAFVPCIRLLTNLHKHTNCEFLLESGFYDRSMFGTRFHFPDLSCDPRFSYAGYALSTCRMTAEVQDYTFLVSSVRNTRLRSPCLYLRFGEITVKAVVCLRRSSFTHFIFARFSQPVTSHQTVLVLIATLQHTQQKIAKRREIVKTR